MTDNMGEILPNGLPVDHRNKKFYPNHIGFIQCNEMCDGERMYLVKWVRINNPSSTRNDWVSKDDLIVDKKTLRNRQLKELLK
jgi:hypothetical protein